MFDLRKFYCKLLLSNFVILFCICNLFSNDKTMTTPLLLGWPANVMKNAEQYFMPCCNVVVLGRRVCILSCNDARPARKEARNGPAKCDYR